MKRVSRPKQCSGLAIKADAVHNPSFVIRSSHAFAGIRSNYGKQ
jgi:hypothetical protein